MNTLIPDSKDTEAPTSVEAIRKSLSQGVEADLKDSRILNDRRRWIDLLTFPGLWAVSGCLVLISMNFREPYSLLLRITGTFLAALAINAMVLLLHEGMHRTLFQTRTLNRCVSVLIDAPSFHLF